MVMEVKESLLVGGGGGGAGEVKVHVENMDKVIRWR